MTALTEEIKTQFHDLGFFFANKTRTPVLRRPDNLPYQDVSFPSLDGTILEAWYIPAKNAKKIVICNHFMPGNRYGFAGHLPQFGQYGGFEVNMIPQYEALHKAGYSVLTYDFRNQGLSSDANGGKIGVGNLEYRDVIGSINYVRSREDTKNLDIGLLSICLGFNSTIIAMGKHPEVFEGVKCIVGLQPISIAVLVEKAAEAAGVDPEEVKNYVDGVIKSESGFALNELSPLRYASSVNIPTKVLQLHNDDMNKATVDVPMIFDKFSTKEKELFWIEGPTQRLQGYNYLAKEPKEMLDWFEKYL